MQREHSPALGWKRLEHQKLSRRRVCPGRLRPKHERNESQRRVSFAGPCLELGYAPRAPSFHLLLSFLQSPSSSKTPNLVNGQTGSKQESQMAHGFEHLKMETGLFGSVRPGPSCQEGSSCYFEISRAPSPQGEPAECLGIVAKVRVTCFGLRPVIRV